MSYVDIPSMFESAGLNSGKDALNELLLLAGLIRYPD